MTTAASARLPEGSGQVTLSVLARSRSGLAPEGVFFRASVRDPAIAEAARRTDPDPSFHDCTYVWDFGDPGAASDKTVNVVRTHNDLNCAFGKEVGHVFTRPGRYTVTCTVHGPGGPVGSDAIEIAVDDPDGAFPDERTILLDPDSPGETDADGVLRIATTLQEARDALEALEAPGRILIRRGAVVRAETTFWLGDRAAGLHLGAYGAGPRPVIAVGRGAEERFLYAGDRFTGDLVLQGLDLRGPWDVEGERGHQLIGLDLVNAALEAGSEPNPRSTVIDDCLFSGFGLAIYLPQHKPAGAVTNTHVHNCRITDWAGYAIYGGDLGDGAVSITGTVLAQNEQAPSGGSQGIGRGNSQGPLRTAERGRIYCAASDFFSRCGWTVIGDIPADQPCLRWNTYMVPGASAHLERCAFEGGISVIASVYSESGDPARAPGNFILEKSLVVGSATSFRLIEWETGGASFRSNLMIRPDTAVPYRGIAWDAALGLSPPGRTPQADPDAPIRFHSNTYVNLMGATTAAGSRLAIENGHIAEFEVFNDENNLVLLPRQPRLMREDPGLERAELETVGGVWRSRYRGLRYGGGRMQEAWATPPGSVALYVPVAGGAAHDTGMGRTAFDDFLGRPRGERPDRGAVERA